MRYVLSLVLSAALSSLAVAQAPPTPMSPAPVPVAGGTWVFVPNPPAAAPLAAAPCGSQAAAAPCGASAATAGGCGSSAATAGSGGGPGRGRLFGRFRGGRSGGCG